MNELVITDGHRKALLRRSAKQELVVQAIQQRTGGGADVEGVWIGAGFAVIVTGDHTRHGQLRHASISHKHRHPTWDEIKAVREAFFAADQDVMMMLPKAGDYVNVHEHCFHLWETPEGWDIQ